eukprot:GDKJ01042567.1.p1 GENE.GDKJ01042567.1~~GDKJ01042567.1.p1  ORF type:complete len:295 (+),score=55.24 GDKJ01042567.1:1-885(+)
MRVFIKKRSQKLFDEINVDPNTSVETFKMQFYQKHGFYPERQKFTVNAITGPVLSDGTFASNGVTSDAVLYFKDLGPQISWRLVFFIEYFGPLIIFPMYWYLPGLIYGVDNPKRTYTQTVAFWLVILHYVKREIETLFIHRFSHGTMPISRLPINCVHYWVIFALSVGYYLFHPNFQPLWIDDMHVNIIAGIMMFFEFMNLKTHMVLRDLRPRNSKVRGIPQGWGFGISTCANYMWEIYAWTAFAVLINSVTGWMFLAVATLQMCEWAHKKQANYVKEFPDYPKHRFVMLPPFV